MVSVILTKTVPAIVRTLAATSAAIWAKIQVTAPAIVVVATLPVPTFVPGNA